MDFSIAELSSAFALGGGLLLGAVVSWAVTRVIYVNRIFAMVTQKQVELEHLSEKLEEQLRKNTGIQSELDEAFQLIERGRHELAKGQQEQAQLEERVKVIPTLNQAVEKTTNEAAVNSQRLSDLREKYGAAESTILALEKQLKESVDAMNGVSSLRDNLIEEKEGLHTRIASLEAELEAEKQQGQEKLALLNEAKDELSNQFKALANDILEDKSKKFTEQNKTNLDQLLKPLQTKLGDFQSKVEEVYIKEGQERSAMAEQIRQVMELNKQLSTDAHNLTRALKGQSKAQGNWGEMILERVLEMSGLRKGHEYEIQESFKRVDGKRMQPDVVVHLPESRHLVIDAKVSLIAYETYVNADDEVAKEAAVKRHLESIRCHIRGLSSKDYQSLYGVESLDFVIMFVPVEPAFSLASLRDATLWQDAWNNNILLVSPSILLFVIRTVAHLWRQEQQSRNAQEIAKRGGDLYNKFSGFVEDFLKVGDRLGQAKAVYDTASKKLSTGRGNLVRQAELLKDLGVEPKKSLPANIVLESCEDQEFLT